MKFLYLLWLYLKLVVLYIFSFLYTVLTYICYILYYILYLVYLFIEYLFYKFFAFLIIFGDFLQKLFGNIWTIINILHFCVRYTIRRKYIKRFYYLFGSSFLLYVFFKWFIFFILPEIIQEYYEDNTIFDEFFERINISFSEPAELNEHVANCLENDIDFEDYLLYNDAYKYYFFSIYYFFIELKHELFVTLFLYFYNNYIAMYNAFEVFIYEHYLYNIFFFKFFYKFIIFFANLNTFSCDLLKLKLQNAIYENHLNRCLPLFIDTDALINDYWQDSYFNPKLADTLNSPLYRYLNNIQGPPIEDDITPIMAKLRPVIYQYEFLDDSIEGGINRYFYVIVDYTGFDKLEICYSFRCVRKFFVNFLLPTINTLPVPFEEFQQLYLKTHNFTPVQYSLFLNYKNQFITFFMKDYYIVVDQLVIDLIDAFVTYKEFVVPTSHFMWFEPFDEYTVNGVLEAREGNYASFNRHEFYDIEWLRIYSQYLFKRPHITQIFEGYGFNFIINTDGFIIEKAMFYDYDITTYVVKYPVIFFLCIFFIFLLVFYLILPYIFGFIIAIPLIRELLHFIYYFFSLEPIDNYFALFWGKLFLKRFFSCINRIMLIIEFLFFSIIWPPFFIIRYINLCEEWGNRINKLSIKSIVKSLNYKKLINKFLIWKVSIKISSLHLKYFNELYRDFIELKYTFDYINQPEDLLDIQILRLADKHFKQYRKKLFELEAQRKKLSEN